MRPAPPCRLARLYAARALDKSDRAAFASHLDDCEACCEVVVKILVDDAFAEVLAERQHRDTGRELLTIGIGVAGLVRELAGDAAWWVFRRALWAVTPAPMREWISWQGASARWRTR